MQVSVPSTAKSPAPADILQQRASLLSHIRGFFAQRGVLEVTTPLMSPTANPDPAIEPIMAGDSYLRTSAEFAMKRLLAGGSGDIYELGPVFRAGESGRMHAPEFTMLEWYRCDWRYSELIAEVTELLHHVAPGTFTDWPQRVISYAELFEEFAAVDPHSASTSELAACCAGEPFRAAQMSRNDWLDLVLATVIQPALPARAITYVHEYPADQAALAKIRAGTPPVAERFELYLGQLELANGYQELTDANEQRRRFNAQNKQRRQLGLAVLPIDEEFVAALEQGLPECTGVALGVDRLLMSILDISDINEVLPIRTDSRERG